MRGIVVPLVGIALFRALLLPLQDRIPELLSKNIAVELPYDLAAGTLAFFLVRSMLTWGVPVMMSHVRAIAVATRPPPRIFLQKLATERIGDTRNVVEALTGDGYRAEDPKALATWFEQFFEEGGSTYIAVDSHLPSEFMQQYDWYLRTHDASLEERGHPSGDIRILATSQTAIARDYNRQYALFQEFYRWHEDRSMSACWLDNDRANALRREYGIGTADIGLWDRFAVLFTPEEHGQGVTLSMVFKNEDAVGRVSYAHVEEFVKRVTQEAIDLAQAGGRLDLVDRELARRWEAYVSPFERLEELGPFLLNTLAGRHIILDAAGGIGSESVFLRRHGFSVFTNEVDSRLADEARAYADRQHTHLKFWRYTWETLPAALEASEGNLRFDGILCLGNSLCLVEDEPGMSVCLAAFSDALLDDGVFIVDERNFQQLLNHRSEIGADPVSAFAPTTQGDIMYRGLDVRGYPSRIEGDAVHWRFFSNKTPRVRTTEEIADRRIGERDLVLYPFRHGALFRLLRNAGFVNIDIYADLKLVSADSEEMPAFELVSDAHFLTYVARRGRGDRSPARSVPGFVDATPHGPGA